MCPRAKAQIAVAKQKITSFFQQIWTLAKKGSQHLILFFLPGPLPVTLETKQKMQNNNFLFLARNSMAGKAYCASKIPGRCYSLGLPVPLLQTQRQAKKETFFDAQFRALSWRKLSSAGGEFVIRRCREKSQSADAV